MGEWGGGEEKGSSLFRFHPSPFPQKSLILRLMLRASFLLPAFLYAQIYIEKRRSGNKAEVQLYSKCSVLHFATDFELTILCDWPEVKLILQ